MKKRLFLLAFLIVVPFLSFTQEYQYVPFPDSGAVWSEMYYPAGDVAYNPALQVFERFAISGEDTLMSNKLYKKLYLFYDSVFTKSKATFIGGIREDSLKCVYFLGDTVHYFKPRIAPNELMLYNFSLNVGDKISADYWHNVFIGLVVTNIDTIQIGNSLRKRFHFDNKRTIWIEGIGSNEGLLFEACPTLTGTYIPENTLICFIQKNALFYHNEAFDDCFPITVGVQSMQKNLVINVYPNPTRDGNIRFELGNSSIETIEIFNVQGIQSKSANVKGDTTVEISTVTLSPGIYMFKATGENGKLQTGKFVVQ